VLLYLYSFFCHCSIKRLLNVSASTAYADSCDCFANYITNMNYNIRITVISINCKNCPIGCPYNLFFCFPPLRVGAKFPVSHFPPLRFGAGFSCSVFSTPVFLTVPGFPVSRFQSPHQRLENLQLIQKLCFLVTNIRAGVATPQ